MKVKLTIINISKSDRRAKKQDPRIFCHPKGETILENFFVGRHNRPVTELKKQVVPQVIEWLKKEHNIDLSKAKISWRQRAGCFCPCSPGFVVSLKGLGFTDTNTMGYFEVFVDYTVEEA